MARLLAVLLTALLATQATVAGTAETFRERELRIEIAGLPDEPAASATRQVGRALATLEESLDALTAGLREQGSAPLTPSTRRLLQRTLQFCRWSQGAAGPLGGELYRLWEEADYPVEEMLLRAAEEAGCDALQLDGEKASVAGATSLDLRSFDLGFAVDLAIETLRAAGVDNALVRLGPVAGAMGAGPGGAGWRVELPQIPGLSSPLAPVRLQDRALSSVLTRDGDLHLDLRSGRPAGEGLLAVFVMTELAVDAQALAEALFAMGSREGDFRAGTLRPPPSVLWLMGSGTGSPLISVRRWDGLHRP